MAKKIVIIGGGIAGLSAGIYGQLNGFETTILEMHTIPGGQCTAWDRKGYQFDYCLHWLVGTRDGVFNKIWRETGVLDDHVKVMDHQVHTKFIDESGDEFIIYANINKWENYMIAMAPEDSRRIRKMCNQMRKFSKLEPFDDTTGKLNFLNKLKSTWEVMPAILLFMRYGKKTVKEYIESLHFQNKKLVSFLQAPFGDNDFSAIAFLMMLGWFDKKNAGYLEGGSLPLIQRMADKYAVLGGKLQINKKVEKIIVENNVATGVILPGGLEIRADYVVSAADGYSTIYNMLGGRFLTPQIENAYKTWPVFTSLVQISLGVAKDLKTEFPNISILCNGQKIGKTELKRYSFMNYSFDPTMAPQGKTSLIMRFESPWELWKDMTVEEYKFEKQQIEKDALILFEKYYPGISSDIEVIDIATPRTDVDYTGVWKGAYEGFLPTSKNLMKSIKMTLPGLSNFYMIGQWLAPGGGLPPSAQSGKTVIKLISKAEKP